jgi:transcription elongation factor Elf1
MKVRRRRRRAEIRRSKKEGEDMFLCPARNGLHAAQ